MDTNYISWLLENFDRCKPWIQAALDRDIGTHTIDDVRDAIMSGECQIWPTENSVCVTRIEQFPRAKVCFGWLGAGDLEEIQASEPNIRMWAKKAGCDIVVISGRRGWLRRFKGYTETSTVLVRRL